MARQFGVSLRKVQYWRARAADQRLDGVDFSDHPPGRAANRTPEQIEDLILELRQHLKQDSDLGEHGAAALRRALEEQALPCHPSVRTIGRILERRGALDGRRRRRFPPPPAGWYLPTVAAGQAELDSFDLIEDLRIEHGPRLDVLTGISLRGALAQAWPVPAQATAQWVMDQLLEHWHSLGLPAYAQFDNDTRFQGAHQYRDVISRVMRLCLSLGITPVFVPPRESAFQASIEAFNGRWQRCVWTRFHHDSLAALIHRSALYIAAHRLRHAPRIDAAPSRPPIPTNWQLDLHAVPAGHVIYLRRTTELGHVSLLGQSFAIDPSQQNRLVRCEVDLQRHCIRCFALHRRHPTDQPLLAEIPHRLLQRKRFQ